MNQIPEYNGPGIYALIDQYGKKYIGSSIHVHDRLKGHMFNIRRIRKQGYVDGGISSKLGAAVVSGSVFRCEVLEMIEEHATEEYIGEREKAWLAREGGQDNTYNGRSICRPVLTQKHHELEKICRGLDQQQIEILISVAHKLKENCQPGDILQFVQEDINE